MHRRSINQSAYLFLLLAPLAACGNGGKGPADGGATGGSGGAASSSSLTTGASTGGSGGAGGGLPTGLTAKVTDTRFRTADHMLASIEMQISGEPFAELLGRDLGGYDRFSAATDMYTDPATGTPVRDLLGWSLAIESYEYSKQSMNNLSFESGAGLSLMFGPLLNPGGVTGDPAYALTRDRVQDLALQSRASGALIGRDFVLIPPPTNDPGNAYGWPAFWPVFAEFKSFDPKIAPSVGADHMCSLAGAVDEPQPGTVTQYVGDYECDYTTLNLVDREAQVEKVIEPDALGYAAWKQGLWVINYWSSMHDVDQDPIIKVADASLQQVGQPGNQVLGQWKNPLEPDTLVFGKKGTFLGDVSLEGFQGLVMLDEMDNKSALLLHHLMITDGGELSGVASVGDALDYDYQAPLIWWPGSVAVIETPTATTAAEKTQYFPQPTMLTIQDGHSRLQDLSGLLGGFAEMYAMTDEGNPEVGGTLPFLATFDGSPFAADDQLPDGEDSPHDRALGILKIALVNLDRLHFDAQHQVLADTATATGPGSTVSTFHTGYSIVSIRTAYRAMASSLTLYSNDTPDVQGAPIALDQTKIGGAPYKGTLGARMIALIRAQADFLSSHLLDADGLAADGYDLAKDARDPAPVSLDAQAGAIRGLLDAYLATSDVKYRERAMQAFAALEKHFWMNDVRAYRTTVDQASTMKYTPRVFGALHGALRQYYKLVASRPGRADEAKLVLDHITRGMKLVVNGWNDANGDEVIDPSECLGGRLQMAERALTGEFSLAADKGDRDHDCVPDIATAGLPAALAGEVTIERK